MRTRVSKSVISKNCGGVVIFYIPTSSAPHQSMKSVPLSFIFEYETAKNNTRRARSSSSIPKMRLSLVSSYLLLLLTQSHNLQVPVLEIVMETQQRNSQYWYRYLGYYKKEEKKTTDCCSKNLR